MNLTLIHYIPTNTVNITQTRHNFVISAITFEGFRLHSSNLTHALLIQISWMSLIIDTVVQSKMAVAYRSEMARNAIESEIQTYKMADVSHCQKLKLRIDVKWMEMRSKVIFGQILPWWMAKNITRDKYYCNWEALAEGIITYWGSYFLVQST